MSSASVVFSPLKNDADSRKSEATGYYDLCVLSLAVKRWRNDCVQRQLPIGTSSGLPRGVNHRFDFIERHDLICSMLGAQCPAGRFLNLLWFGRRITSGRVGRRNHWHPRARGAVVSLSFSDRHRLVGLSPHPSDGDRSCWFRSPAALIGELG